LKQVVKVLLLLLLYILTFFVVPITTESSTSKWEAQFYPNFDLSGTPIKETYESISFNWGWDSPHSSIPSDYFSAKFIKTIETEKGIYNLKVSANDGVRVFVDGELVIDGWDNNQGLRHFDKPIYLEKGQHNIEINYREVVGVAELHFDMEYLSTGEGWSGIAYTNPDLTGKSVRIGNLPETTAFHKKWDWDSPAPNIPSDNFSVLLQNSIEIEDGLYNVEVEANDRVQVYIDGDLVIDEWDNNQGLKFFQKPVKLKKGKHDIVIKYSDVAGIAELKFNLVNVPKNKWIGIAYSNTDMTGESAIIENMPETIDFHQNWGRSAPAPNIPADNFLVYLQREIEVEEGIYNVEVEANDRVQVYVDGELVIDEWDNDQGLKKFENPVYLRKGNHTLVIKYSDVAGLAELNFTLEESIKDDRWHGIAFSNPDFTGKTAKLGYDKKIQDLKFNWGLSSPASDIPKDNFSTVFQRNLNVEEGLYDLSISANDGVQVYIDGELLIDELNNTGKVERNIPVYLKSGKHKVLVKHKDVSGEASLNFGLVQKLNANGWYGVAYSNPDLTGDSAELTNLPQTVNIHKKWDWDAPAPNIPADNFSVLLQRSIEVEEGLYNVEVEANDRVQVYIDGELIIDEWNNDQGLKFFDRPVYLKSGSHNVVIKYSDVAGLAELKFDLTDNLSSDQWIGLAYSNPDFTGKSAKIENMPQTIDFHYNWERNAPAPNIPADNFSTIFYKNVEVKEGIYNVEVHANDRVQIYIDGELVIDEWDNTQGLKYFDNPIYLKAGRHDVVIKYSDVAGLAELKFNLSNSLNTNKWVGIAYSRPDLTGESAIIKDLPETINFHKNWGWGSPAPNIPVDHFSSIFQKNITVQEGAYNLRVNANDGVQVFVDGVKVIDEWDNDQGLKFFGKPVYLSAGSHVITIKHKELVGVAELQFEIDDLLRENRWYGLAFPNQDFSGTPVLLGYQPQIPELNFDWGTGSPHESIPVDHFSTLFQRYIVTENGEYELNVTANDGVRVYIDGELVLDEFDNVSRGSWVKTITLSAGKHHVLVKNFEITGVAELSVSIKAKEKVTTKYVDYNLTLDQMTNIQMNAGPLTDKSYKLWIRGDAFVNISNGKGSIGNSTWNLRRGPGTNYMIDGQVTPNSVLTIYSSTRGSDGYTWYHVKNTSGWVTPDRSDLQYYIDSNNFQDFRGKLQFLKLSESASLDPAEVNTKILNNNAGVLKGKAQNFINAGKKYGINEIYLISHALLESGNGKSDLADGSIQVGELTANKWVSIQPNGTYIAELINGNWSVEKVSNFDLSKAKNIKKTYNMFGIGAYDRNAATLGSVYAYRSGWYSVDAAIDGGAKFIGNGYVDKGQDTLYKMRWNPDFAESKGYASHQYASDIGWAYKQTYKMYELYNMLDSYSIIYEIPRYKK
jgi:beta-N-acetylglucosaminidase